MARLLRDRGDDVELVALVDTVAGGQQAETWQSPAEKYRELYDNSGWRAAAGEGLGRARERLDFALARRRYRVARSARQTPDLRDAERQLGPVVRTASLGYKPNRIDGVPVLFFAASESGSTFTIDPWTEVQGTDEGFEIVHLDGVHFLPEDECIIGPGKAPALVAELIRRLR